MSLPRTENLPLTLYEEFRLFSMNIENDIDFFETSFKKSLIDQINQVVKNENALSGIISPQIGLLIVKLCTTLNIKVAEDHLEIEIFKQIQTDFEKRWQEILIHEGPRYLLKDSPRAENYEEKNLRIEFLNILEKLQAAKKIQLASSYISRLAQNMQNNVSNFIDAAKAAEAIRVQKNIQCAQMQPPQRRIQKIKERLNDVIAQQQQIFSLPSSEIQRSLQLMDDYFHQLEKLPFITDLNVHLHRMDTANGSISKKRAALMHKGEAALLSSQHEIRQILVDIAEYRAAIENEKQNELVKINHSLDALRAFLKDSDIERIILQLIDKRNEISQRQKNIITLKAENQHEASINVIRHAFTTAKEEIEDLIKKRIKIQHKIENQYKNSFTSLDKIMNGPASRVDNSIEEFRYAQGLFFKQENIAHTHAQNKLSSMINQILQVLENLQLTWEENKKIIIDNLTKQFEEVKSKLTAQVQYLKNCDLTNSFDPHKIIMDEMAILQALHDEADKILSGMQTFSNTSARLLTHVDFQKILDEHNAVYQELKYNKPEQKTVIDLEEALHKQNTILCSAMREIREISEQTAHHATRIEMEFITIDDFHLTSTTEKTNSYKRTLEKYLQRIRELSDDLDTCDLLQLQAKKYQFCELSGLLNALEKQVVTHTKYLYKNITNLRRAEEQQKSSAERAIWQKINLLSSAEKIVISNEEKLIFLKYECKQYAAHLQKYSHPLAKEKLHIINNYQYILNQSIPINLKIQEFTNAFCERKNITLLERCRDNSFITFFKAIASIILPKNYLYRVAGKEFLKRITPTVNHFSLFSDSAQERNNKGEEMRVLQNRLISNGC